MTKRKNIGESVKYFEEFGELSDVRVDADRSDWSKWTLKDIRTLLAQSVYHCINLVTEKMLNKPEGLSDLDVWNKVAGVEIKRTGMAHSLFYTFENFKNAVERDSNPKNKEILTDLCLLFGAHTILNSSPAIVEGGFIQPAHLTSLLRLKEELLDKLRTQLIGLLDSFVLPENIIRSALTTGDPYQVSFI